MPVKHSRLLADSFPNKKYGQPSVNYAVHSEIKVGISLATATSIEDHIDSFFSTVSPCAKSWVRLSPALSWILETPCVRIWFFPSSFLAEREGKWSDHPTSPLVLLAASRHMEESKEGKLSTFNQCLQIFLEAQAEDFFFLILFSASGQGRRESNTCFLAEAL